MSIRNAGATACLLAIGLLRGSEAASMNVHSLVSYRAQQYYAGVPNMPDVDHALRNALQSAITAQPESVAAGADFPDFLYACGDYADHHDAGEAAHWPQFHVPAVRYVRNLPDFNRSGSAVPYTWSADTQKLVAFIYGLTVHYVTDEIWEGLAADFGFGHGFVELVNGLNRAASGTGDQDEGTANMAGDYYAAWILNETGLHPWQRDFPLKHVVEIYHQTPEDNPAANFTNVTLSSLDSCELLFDLGLWALKTFGSLLEPFNNNQIKEVPMVAERLLDMPFSGLDGMATATAFEWARLSRWFMTGPPNVVPPRASSRSSSLSSVAAKDAAADGDDRRTAAFFRDLRPYAHAGAALKAMPEEARSQLFTAVPPVATPSAAPGIGGDNRTAARRAFLYHGPAKLQDELTGVLRAVVVRHCGDNVVFEVTKAAKQENSPAAAATKTNAHTGAAVAAAERDRAQQGKRQTISKPFGTPTPLSTGSAPVQYHGHAIATGDFDHDGHPDIAVGAYGAGVQADLPQAGQVSILYNASAFGSTLRSSQPRKWPQQQQWSVLQAPQRQPVAQFGRALAVLDFNLDGVDDLAISAPGASDWNLTSQTANPYPANSSVTSFRMWGKVYVLLGEAGTGLDSSRAIILESSQDWTMLGEVSVAADINNDGHPDLLLGMPSACSGSTGATHGGRVIGVLSSASNAASPTGVDVETVAALQLSGRAKFEMFGQSMAMVGTSTLLVGAPFSRINNITTGQATIATGRVYGYSLSTSSISSSAQERNGQHSRNSSSNQDVGVRVAAKVDFEIAAPLDGVLGEFGFAIASSNAHVAISAPTVGVAGYKRGGDARHGMVLVAENAVFSSLKGNVSLSTVPWVAQLNGDASYARFGYSLGFADANNDGVADLVAGAPMETIDGAKFDQRELGGVYVWNGAAPLPAGNHSTASASWQGRGTHPRGRFGAAFAAIPGLGFAVAAPRASTADGGEEMIGAVDLFTDAAHGTA